VLASWHEPLGVAYMEAMAAGVPVIGTDAGGVRELLTDGETGLLVPPQSPEALAGAIARLAGDPALCARLSEAGRAHVVAGYDSARGAEALIAGVTRAAAARAAAPSRRG
jgi:glycosyltransferase involved in cell wall biosynthesis